MMKVAIVLVVVSLASCNALAMLFYDAENYQFDSPERFSSVADVFDWTFRNLRYTNQDEWLLPHETYSLGAGDCKNTAILDMYWLHTQLGASVKMVVVRMSPSDGNVGHALVEVNGVLFDPETSTDRWTVPWTYEAHPGSEYLYEYSYKDALARAAYD